MMKICAALWGSQSWLQPAFSRPSAGHEGSLMAQKPPERRLRARLPAPRLFSRKAPPCASERSSDVASERSSDVHLAHAATGPCDVRAALGWTRRSLIPLESELLVPQRHD